MENTELSVPRNCDNVPHLGAQQGISHTVRTPNPKRSRAKGRIRGQIIAKGDKKWLVRAFVGFDAKGKRDYKSEIVHGAFSQAQQALTGMIGAIDTEQFVAPSKQLLTDYLTNWLDTTATMRVSVATLTSYRSVMSRVMTALGHHRLDKITPQMIQQVYSGMTADGLSPRSVEVTHTILKQALEQAVVWRLIPRNPTKGAERPARSKAEMHAFNAEEVDLFLEAARSSTLPAIWLAFVATGLRPQEMFALKWTDIEQRIARVQRNGAYIDAPTTILNVQRAMKHVGKGRYEPSSTLKTKKSKRTVAIPQTLVDALNAHKRTQAEQMLAAGERFERNGYIFTNRNGRPLDVNNVRDLFHALCVKAKVRKIRLYDLRHTHATLLLGAGVHLKVVSERLGHSSIMLTGDTYSHVMPEVEHETALTVEALLRKAV